MTTRPTDTARYRVAFTRAQRARVNAALSDIAAAGFATRLWAHDSALWSDEDAVRATIARRLGWLDTIEPMRAAAPGLRALGRELRAEGVAHVVVLGMGGSSLAPEVLAALRGSARGWPRLHVLDSTVPAAVEALTRAAPVADSVYVVASKSGTTVETAAFMDHYMALAAGPGGDAARRFIAVTDPDTVLEEQARRHGFRAVFINDPDIGGRYSALSYFGLVPAALTGWDVTHLLARADGFARRCGAGVPETRNPGLQLGAALGALALDGRDKLTLALSPALAPIGPWIEQLVAESSGKEGRGILPVDGEVLGAPVRYGEDRVFVAAELAGEAGPARDAALAALARAGHPVIRWQVEDRAAIGAEFLRWEIATAAACAVLGVNPFDEPNVSEAKDTTRALLAEPAPAVDQAVASDEHLEVFAPTGVPAADPAAILNGFLDGGVAGDYTALLAYLARDAANEKALARVRAAIAARRPLATTVGFGPRYLHSTGQLHKGGANNGLFIVITADAPADAPLPGRDFGFARLHSAQALGDVQTLRRRGRRVVRVHLRGDPARALAHLARLLARAR